MPDFDMSILNNPNLGKDNGLPFGDELEAQAFENLNAKREGRTPRTIAPRERHGEYAYTNVNGPLEFTNGDPYIPGRALTEIPPQDNVVVPNADDVESEELLDLLSDTE